jgi:hypothetical protein
VGGKTGAIGAGDNQITLISTAGSARWPRLSKAEVAGRLTGKIVNYFKVH